MEALDGNAIGGMLYHVFGREMTMVQATCGRCGARGPLAECEVYLGGPGAVVRCRLCHTIVMVFVTVREMMCVDIGGLGKPDGVSGDEGSVRRFGEEHVAPVDQP